MNSQLGKIKNLFMQQSYLDSWEDYRRSLEKGSFIKWDYIVLTASNEAQADAFKMQIESRLSKNLLPSSTKYVYLPDPGGKRVGSGGATFNVIKYIMEEEGTQSDVNCFKDKRILVIHSGGDSKRVPQYSAVGKLFSPVPRQLPDGRASTLFDEFIIGMSGVASRFKEGMLVLSGDVLLLFNPLQIDATFDGAAAISIKEPVETGKDHGVFLNDGNGYVKNFLHKQTEETLKNIGAVNEQGAVDLDTGAILLDANILDSLAGLIKTEDDFNSFVNEQARVSFYGDILYPLASASTLEQYYLEKPEGEFTEELKACRTKLWEVLSPYSLKLFCLSPARFIHFGTTRELRSLMSDEISEYEFLSWSSQVASNLQNGTDYSTYESYVGRDAVVGSGAYLEQSYVLGKSRIGSGCVISNVKLRDIELPENVVLHALPVKYENEVKYVARVYGVKDNPKTTYEENGRFMSTTIRDFVYGYKIDFSKLWDGNNHDLWTMKLYPICDSMEEAVEWAIRLCKPMSDDVIALWLSLPRMSLMSSFNSADTSEIMLWQNDLRGRILCRRFTEELMNGVYCYDALKIFGADGLTEEIFKMLINDAKEADFSLKIRIYYAVSRYMKMHQCVIDGCSYDTVEGWCFKTIQDVIYNEATKSLPDSKTYHIVKQQVDVKLPVRVNWGGGWTDTPPYCNEMGGTVLNAAISLNGILPVQITVKKLDNYHIEFESQDIGVKGTFTELKDIQDCHNPYDSFALHKAALIACGIIPLVDASESLEDILKRIGGGIYLSTQVVGIPKGSGLGTSSILAGACVKGIFEFLGINKPIEETYEIVLCMEQIMSTGGGWQDQVGGLTGGVKMITTDPGIKQDIRVDMLHIPEKAMAELQERFAVIYTGQRRLARNLLRDVVGGYIGSRPESVDALEKMASVAALMRFHLERGDIDKFAKQLDAHWELSKQLDGGSTNTCIDQIFLACEDLIDARFIAGAGGGGFLMVVLKKGVSKADLKERLNAIFQNSGVDVWDSEFVI